MSRLHKDDLQTRELDESVCRVEMVEKRLYSPPQLVLLDTAPETGTTSNINETTNGVTS
ncbi:MAG: hypothetical protein P1U32_00125 [Legionellaceae bacterium]|nr:hypothetical protein [Legionellaceae bacterium]